MQSEFLKRSRLLALAGLLIGLALPSQAQGHGGPLAVTPASPQLGSRGPNPVQAAPPGPSASQGVVGCPAVCYHGPSDVVPSPISCVGGSFNAFADESCSGCEHQVNPFITWMLWPQAPPSFTHHLVWVAGIRVVDLLAGLSSTGSLTSHVCIPLWQCGSGVEEIYVSDTSSNPMKLTIQPSSDATCLFLNTCYGPFQGMNLNTIAFTVLFKCERNPQNPPIGSLQSLSPAGIQAAAAADVRELSLASGGVQNLRLFAASPPGPGGESPALSYLLLGSASGVRPGTSFGSAVLPLQADAYLFAALADPVGLGLGAAAGALDATGGASASVALAPGSDPSLAGRTLHHAALIFDGGEAVAATNPVPLVLTP